MTILKKNFIGYLRKHILLVVLIVAIASAAGVYSYQLYQKNKTPEAIEDARRKMISETLLDVGKIILLPEEVPVIGEVVDPKLMRKGQNAVFFESAQKGDKFLLYREAKKAILYRPSLHKIINISAFMDISPPEPAQGGGAPF